MSQAEPGAKRRHDMERDGAAKAREAIERGDKAAALAAVSEILAEERPIHDLYGDMAASLLTFIAGKLGEAAIEEAWRHVARDVWTPLFLFFKEKGDAEGLANAFAGFLKSHRYDFEVWEDDTKWVFVAKWCTSGERMLVEGKVAGQGGDPRGHHRFGATSEAYPWSFGRAGLPYYDVHSAVWMHLLPRELGWEALDCEYDVKPNGHFAVTKYVVYKRAGEAQ
jgi:hypothetical protein